MAGQQGFLYEGRVFNKLKSKNLVPPGVKPGGANPNAPDAVFLYYVNLILILGNHI